jgi:hypothetical protein
LEPGWAAGAYDFQEESWDGALGGKPEIRNQKSEGRQKIRNQNMKI